jgi:hypothetical protein
MQRSGLTAGGAKVVAMHRAALLSVRDAKRTDFQAASRLREEHRLPGTGRVPLR